MIQATGRWQYHKKLAKKCGVELYLEAFADRGYEEDGTLRDRRYDDALLDADAVLARVRLLCRERRLKTVSGKDLEFPVDTLCVHGDSPAGVSQIERIRSLLEEK